MPFAQCNGIEGGIFENITLKDITINNPKLDPGVLMAHENTRMKNIIFDNVVVNNPPKNGKWGKDYYKVSNV